MKKTLVATFSFILFISISYLSNSFAQDLTLLGLPEGARARLGSGRVTEVAYSPDGNRFVIADSIGIWVYDAHTGEDLALLTEHNTIVFSLVFSRDGNTLMSSGEDGIVRLWDVNTGRLKRSLRGHKSLVRTVVLSPDGNTLAGEGGSLPNVGSTIRLWDANTGRLKHTLTGPKGSISNVAFSPDGSTLVGSENWPTPIIYLWNPNTGRLKHTLTGHKGGISNIAFSSNTTTLVSRGRDGIVYLSDVNTGRLKHTLTGHNGSIYDVRFNPNGRTLVSRGNDNTIQLWNPNTGARIRTLTGHKGTIRSVAFSPDGNILVSGDKDGTIQVWNANTGKLKHTLTGHNDAISSVSFSPDGNTLVSTGWNGGSIRLWDPNTGKPKQTLEQNSRISSVAFSPDGKTLMSRGKDGTVRLWNPNTGTNIRNFIRYKYPVSTIAFSPDGDTLAGARHKYIRLWDANTGAHKRTFKAHTTGVQTIAFSPDGNTIVSSGYGRPLDNQLLLWDANTGKLKQKLSGRFGEYLIGKFGFPNITFSPDGNIIAGVSGGRVYLWGANTGEVKRKLTGHPYGVSRIAFSPDGTTIVGGSWSPDIYLWNAKTGKLKQTLTGHAQWVDSVAFSPDGYTIASGGRDNTLRLWDAKTGKLKRKFIGHTHWVYNVAFSPDGYTIASTERTFNNFSRNGIIHLWNAKTGKLKRKLTGHTHWVSSLTFSPDGYTLASASEGIVLLWDLAPPTQVFVTASRRPPMYWIDTRAGTLHRLVADKVENILPNIKNATHLAVDTINSKLYWTTKISKRSGKIQRANLNGSNVQLVKNLTSVPLDIAVDTINGKLYLTNSWGKLQRLNLDGSAFQPNLITGLQAPKHLALDAKRGKVYWTEQTDDNTGKVRSANLNGSNVRLVKTLASPPYGLTIDPANRKLYLMSASGKIQRMTLTGTYFQPNFITNLGSLGEITVDTAGRKLYWTESGRIRRANLNGKNIQDIVTRLGAPADIALGIMLTDTATAAAPTITVTPDQTLLLSNYPNPFNPETWIPYQLATPAEVSLYIYAVDGRLIRTLALGHQPVGIYHSKDRAMYWDGRNQVGEPVASGVYFYTLTAGDFSATQRMLIRK